MKLFVDDFRPAPPGWHRVKNVSDAIRMMDNQELEALALDHDIEGSVETFEPVARHFAILVLAEKQSGEIPVFIHTGNPIGGDHMVHILQHVGCANVSRVVYPGHFFTEGDGN